MAESTKATTKMTKKRDTAFLFGQTDGDTMVCGSTASKRARERITVQMANHDVASGETVNAYSGFEY